MAHYNVGSDHSGKGDTACIDAVCKVLEEAGHTTTNLGVNSNLEGSLKKGSGNIGVFIVNGMCLGTIVSCAKMAEAGGCDHVWFGIPKPIMAEPYNDLDAIKTQKLGIAHDDNFSPPDVRAMSGKYTPHELFEQYDSVDYAYGETCEEVGQAILNGGNGGDSGNTTTSEGEGSVMSGWESLTDLLKPLDGDAMLVVRDDAVIVKRIYPPNKTQLWAYEGINVIADSVSVSDYSPEIYNTFTVKWGAEFENEMEFCFEKHKELFGERRTEVEATYDVPIEDTGVEGEDGTGTGTDATSGTETEQEEDGGLFGWLLGNNQAKTPTTDATANLGTTGAEGLDSSSLSGTDSDEPKTEKVPITDKGEAYLFGLKCVGKARRKDGHKIEMKVIGSKYWEVGEWCHIYLPSFDEDVIMFISKVSHESSADSEWLTNLTLVDYPPSLGTGQSNSPSSNESSEEESTDEESSDSDSENGDGSSDSESGTDTGTDSGNSGDS